MSLFQQTDDKLIEKALKGNQSAWRKLVDRYEKNVYLYALRMTSNQHDAMDVMQETFISVCRSLSDFRGDSSFKTWVLKIAHFRCIEFYRRRKWFADESELQHMDAEPEHSCPELALGNSQSQKQLLTVMKLLPFEQKLIVELKVFQSQTFDTIGQQLGVSTNTVKSRFYTALDKLKVLLEDSYDAA
ncbi:RNA polymerase sigma factor [Psychrosphaera algicola]|uniref:Sigma-70 family RNA polymerase sigma factor n=1 Tax=Psychrosphaera algicola TaxID=3023714 RepID=A0ABT5FEB3_9GAMM|nr:sigma-70 family RNA polymerase sigma factor [Psychrosphaera sp. G1-22]MDC2889890.1 sigma-70 family RNA polymerase sigma factor [Psychrosphaera sp. G1-22]